MLKKVIILLVVLGGISTAQEKQFNSHDVFRTKAVDQTEISPDGKYAAFTLDVPRMYEGKSGKNFEELYLYSYEDNSIKPLITGEVFVEKIGWTAKSKYVSFTAKLKGDKKHQIYLVSLDGKEIIRLTDSKTKVLQFAWHPKQNKVAYIAEEFLPKSDFRKMGFDQEIFEEHIPDRNLYLMDKETGNTEILNESGAVFNFEWSHDGKSIAAAVAPQNLVDHKYMFTRLHIIDVAAKKMTKLIENPGKLGNFSWSPDGKHLVFISGKDKNDAVDGSLFVVEVPNIKKFTELKNYSEKFLGSVTDVNWLDNENFLLVSEEGVHTTLRKQKVGSDESELLVKHGEVVFKEISKSSDKIVFQGETPSHPDELYTFDLSEGKVVRNTFHNEWLKDVKLAKQKVIEYPASDGLQIEGLLFYPLNYEEGKKYPMIIYVHGGPEATNSYGWNTAYNRWGQSAAAKGFFVFMPNYRAGSGRGYDFTMMGYADAGGREFDDVIDGINYLVEKGYVDKNRVGIGGGSYGGYFSAWGASKHTEHFAAAVSFVGVGNNLSKRNTTDIPWESYLVHWGFWPNENPMDLYDRSPVKYSEQMNTPLLILHGTKDPRVHPAQSLEMYRSFKLRGKAPVRLVWYPGEEHGNKKNTGRLDYHLRTLNWFEYYLKGDNPKDKMPSYEVDYGLKYFEEIK